MPYWRGIFVVALGLSTSGCLFSAYQIASLTASGVSYVFSGKGMGDHALSIALDKDCATLRIFEGEAICSDYGSEYNNSWEAMAATWQIPELDDSPARVPAGTGETGSLLAEADQIGGPITGTGNNSEELSLLPASGAPVQVSEKVQLAKPVAVAFSRGDDSSFAEAVQDKLSAPALDFDALIPAEDEAKGTAPDSVVRMPRALPETVVPDTNTGSGVAEANVFVDPGVFLVIGSFRDNANARKLVDRHRGMNTAVMTVNSSGRKMYRVVAGPIDSGDLHAARGRLVREGIRNSWAVRLCRGNLALPPCHEPAIQQALLPAR